MASTTANLSKTVNIHTEDDKIMEISGKLIDEFEWLKNSFEVQADLVDPITVPFYSNGLKKVLQFLEFYDLNEPFTRNFNNRAFLQANEPVMQFLYDFSDEDYFEMEYAIDYLKCNRLDDCLRLYMWEVNKNGDKFEILSEPPFFMDVLMSDNITVKVPKKIIEESKDLLYYYTMFRCIPDDEAVPFSSVHYHKVLKALNLCDLDTPHVPLAIPAINEPATSEMLAFKQANQPVMNYFNSLMSLDLYEIIKVAYDFYFGRLSDLLNVYIFTLDEDRQERVFRAQLAIDAYFRHMEAIQNGEDSDYVLPAEGA